MHDTKKPIISGIKINWITFKIKFNVRKTYKDFTRWLQKAKRNI